MLYVLDVEEIYLVGAVSEELFTEVHRLQSVFNDCQLLDHKQRKCVVVRTDI